MKNLDCNVFSGNNPLTRDIIESSRVAGGSEAIKDFLREKHNWDGFSNVASTAVNLTEEGELDSWQLFVFGKREGFRKESSIFFPNQEPGHVVRLLDYDMDLFVFRGMVSDWLAPDQYKWQFRMPHETDEKQFYRVKEADLEHYNAKPLYLRAVAQVVPGPNLEIKVGCIPALNIKEVPGHTSPEFPLIFINKFNVSFLPFEKTDMGLGMGPIPCVVDTREEVDGIPDLPDGQDIKTGQAAFLQTAIKPNMRNEVKAWTKDVGQGQWVAREPNYRFQDPKPLEGDIQDEGDDDDGAGIQNC